jgi:hypothetical protein
MPLFLTSSSYRGKHVTENWNNHTKPQFYLDKIIRFLGREKKSHICLKKLRGNTCCSSTKNHSNATFLTRSEHEKDTHDPPVAVQTVGNNYGTLPSQTGTLEP